MANISTIGRLPAQLRLGRSRPGRLIKKLIRYRNDFGIAYTALRVLESVTPSFLFGARKMIIVESRLSASAIARRTEADLRWGSVADLDALLRLEPNPRLPHWFERGDDFVIAESRGRIVGYENFRKKPDGTSEGLQIAIIPAANWVRLSLRPTDVMAIMMYIDREHRGQRLPVDIQNFAADRYAREGFKSSIGTINPLNANAFKAHARRGYEIIATFYFIRILSLAFVKTRDGWRCGWWTDQHPLVLGVGDLAPYSG